MQLCQGITSFVSKLMLTFSFIYECNDRRAVPQNFRAAGYGYHTLSHRCKNCIIYIYIYIYIYTCIRHFFANPVIYSYLITGIYCRKKCLQITQFCSQKKYLQFLVIVFTTGDTLKIIL